MSAHKTSLAFVILSSVLWLCITSDAGEKPWYAGTWDSTLYLLAEHPKTVAIRMELLDKDTHIAVEGVQVSLEGEYFQMWISQDIVTAESLPWWNIFVDPTKREPQPKEFKLDAISDSDGVVVFALQWQKEFPWDSKIGDKWTYKVGDQWIVYLDDIEKVQRLEIRHPQYKYIEAPLDFGHLVSMQQYIEASRRGEDRIKRFEDNWKNEIRRQNVKLFVLDLGAGFAQYNEQFCKQPEFFQKVRARDYGLVYRDAANLPNLADRTQCGAYFVYDLGEILLEPIATRVSVERAGGSVLTRDTSEGGAPWYSQYSRQPGASSSAQTSVASPAMDSAGTLLNQEEALLRAEIEKFKSLSLPSMEDIRNDPTKLAGLIEKGSSMKNELAIAGIRSLPMVDPDTKQMTTLDAYARKLVESRQLGGSLGEDPVATAYMMLFDSNFLVDQAQIIRLKDGRYVTLTEAIGIAAEQSDSGLDPEVLTRAVKTAASLHQASRLSQGQLMSKALTGFLFAVSEANALKAAPAVLEDPSAYQDQDLYCPELSMGLRTLTPALRKELGLYVGVQGAVITRIDPNAPPGHDDLKPGMVVESWRHEPVADAENLASKARELVANPATARSGGRDQAILGVWKWNGTLWERDYVVIWVVGKQASDVITGRTSGDEIAPNLTEGKSIDLGNGIRMELVLIPAGDFYMGSSDSEKDRYSDEGPVRRVQITRPFYIGKYEVTQDQYMAVMGSNPSHFSGRDLPVEQVSWDEAVAFCRKIGGRVPTEAEWEYACRAGSSGRFSFGDSDSNLDQYAWYNANSANTTHPVGQKGSNSFGLYDMHGNVWEWCQDWYAENYRNASAIDPQGPSSGKHRVVRGGCWYYYAGSCRSANRYFSPVTRIFTIGFRVALDSN